MGGEGEGDTTMIGLGEGEGVGRPGHGGVEAVPHVATGGAGGEAWAQEAEGPADVLAVPQVGCAPEKRPPMVGWTNCVTGVPATAAIMNFCQMVAGRLPPTTGAPRTSVMGGVWPVLGSGGKPIQTAAVRFGV